MKLTDLLLNRQLYRDADQDDSTKDAVFQSVNSNPEEPAPLLSGEAAQDINTSNVFVNGQQLEEGTIPQTTLDVSNWGWGQTSAFTSADLNTVNWGAGTFTSAGGTSYAISAGNTGDMSAKTYVYLDLLASETQYQITTTSADSVGLGKVLIAVAQNAASNATFNLSEATQIVGDNILANTINASKMNVAQLSSISANIGTITSGLITGATVQTATSGYRLVMSGSNNSYEFRSGATLLAELKARVTPDSGLAGGVFQHGTGVTGIEITGQGEGAGSRTISSFTSNNGYFRINDGDLSSDSITTNIPFTSTTTIAASNLSGTNTGNQFTNTTASRLIGRTSASSGAAQEITLGTGLSMSGTTLNASATGANTALSNLSSVAINTSLISDTASLDNLGSSGTPWNDIYVDDIYLTNGSGGIRYNSNLAIDIYASRIELGSSYNELSPASNLLASLGTSANRWNEIYVAGGFFYGAIDMNGNDITDVDIVSGTSGNIDYSITGRIQISNHFDPADGGSFNMGGSTRYWGDISYKTLTDRGCLGWYDDGVEMRNGEVVSDVEALKSLKKHPTLKTPAGAARIDYTSMPKHVYIPAMNHKKEILPQDEDGNYYEMVEQKVKNEETGKMEKKLVKMKAEEGAETTALIAIMIGAIKELSGEIDLLKKIRLPKQ